MPRMNLAPMRTARWMLAACLGAGALTAGGATAYAADGPEAPPPAAAQPPDAVNRPDFLFGQPRGMIGLSGGLLRAEGGTKDGLLGFFREELTIGDRGYDSLLFRFTGGVSVAPRVDLVFDVDVSRSRAVSENRDFTDGDLPIVQTTELTQVPLNVGVRFWVVPRGRRIGRLAWVPNTLAFHIGVGGGARRYQLAQFGEFVDYRDLVIFSDRYESRGWAASRHFSTGASIRLSRRVFAVAELRRVWSRRDLADDFTDRLDLDGLQMTGGIEFLF